MNPSQPGFAPIQPAGGVPDPDPNLNPSPNAETTGAQMPEMAAQAEPAITANTMAPAEPIAPAEPLVSAEPAMNENPAPASEPDFVAAANAMQEAQFATAQAFGTAPAQNFGENAVTAQNEFAQNANLNSNTQPEPTVSDTPQFISGAGSASGQQFPNSAQPSPFAAASTATMDGKPFKKKRSILPIIIVVLLLGVIIAALVIFLPKLKGGSSKNKEAQAGTVLLREKVDSGDYALFDLKTGKKLTDFIYKEGTKTPFGYTIAKDADGKSVALNEKGEVAVTAADGFKLESCGAAFKSVSEDTDKDKSDKSLLSTSGEVLASNEKDFGCVESTEYYYYKGDDGTKLYGKDGGEVLSFASNTIKRTADNVLVDGNDYYIISKDGVGGPYTIKGDADDYTFEASEDGKLAIWSDRSGDSRFMLQNGVVTDLSEECNYGLDFAFGDAGYVECSSIDGDGDEERFSFKTTSKIVLDAEKKKMIEVDFTDEVSFIDSNHFAVQRDEDQIDIYVDGEKKKTIESEAKIGKVESDNENFYTLMKVKEITQSSGDEEEGFSWTSTTTADRVEGLTILDLNGEQIYDLGTDCSSRSSVNYLGEKLFTCTAAKDAESDKTTGIFNLDLNQPRVLFKDGKKLDIGDFNIMSSATKDRIIVADADLNSMIGDLMGAAFSSMMGASDESAGLNVLEKIKINSIGIIDTNGEYIVNPGDYNGLAIDFKRFVVDMQSITSNSIMPVDIDTSQISDELPLKRADGKGSDLVSIENGEVIKNIQGVFVLGNGYYGIEADDGIEYFLLDGTSFYKQQK